MSSSRLVSIVIPAYKPDFFAAALASALRQNHDEIEIVVCDDCPNDAIKHIVDTLSPGSRWPIRYLKNTVALGEAHNIARCVQEARGAYIKFLYDDDILLPDCTRLLFEVLHESPDIKLASATRKRIDKHGKLLPDSLYTLNPFGRNVVLNGPDLVSFLGRNPVNFIGEPSSVMCRRSDLLAFGQDIMSLKEVIIVSLGDVALYLKLLRHGNLALLARPLSYFRVSQQQGSEALRANPAISQQGHANYYRFTQELGWLRPQALNDKVRVAPLAQRANVQELNLLAHFDRRSQASRRNTEVAGWLSQRKPTPAQHALLKEYLEGHEGGPAIAIVVSDFNHQPESVLNTLQSLASDAPLLDKLKVFILADYDKDAQSPLQAQLPWLPTSVDNRATVINGLMQDNDHQWWLLVDAGTTFTASGLLSAVMSLMDAPHACALFGDEVQLDGQTGASLVFRPDFSIDYLLAQPGTASRHWLFNRDAALTAGGFDPEHARALELDLILRLIEHPSFTGFLHSAEPLVIVQPRQAYDTQDEVHTLQRHLQARGYADSHISQSEDGAYRINYGHADQPLVSILVICDGPLEVLLPCIDSLLEHTAYQNYEILIADNNSHDADTVQWLTAMDAMHSDKIRILRQAHTLSRSALLNAAAEQARGEYLVMLDHAASIIQTDWLDNLLDHALRPEVGVTGAKIVSPDGSLKLGGIVLGLQGSAAAISEKEALLSASFQPGLNSVHNYSAVSGQCLVIRKSLFDDVQGLDEQLFHQFFDDIDLCLKVRETGHLIVWTPHAIVASRALPVDIDLQAHDFAVRALYHRWLHCLAWDPAYSRNFTLQPPLFSTQQNHELSWRPLPHRPLPVLLVLPGDHGTTGNRVADPLQGLRTQGSVDGIISHAPLQLPEFARLSPDSILIQGQGRLEDGDMMSTLKNHLNASVVYDLTSLCGVEGADSLLALPETRALLSQTLASADKVTVPTPALAELLMDLHPNVQVIETRLAPQTWLPLQSRRGTRDKPRVGWIGNALQASELEILTDVIKALADKVEWVIMGHCSRWLRPYIHELHDMVDATLYPGVLASLDLDLVLVPAQGDVSSQSKDPVALLEFGVCGFPVICSDTLYSADLPVTRVVNQPSAWLAAIEAHISQPGECARTGDELKRTVTERWMLDAQSLETWRAVSING